MPARSRPREDIRGLQSDTLVDVDDLTLPSLLFVDPVCRGCRSYVHRYIERCPACGAARAGGFEAALFDWRALEEAGPAASHTSRGGQAESQFGRLGAPFLPDEASQALDAPPGTGPASPATASPTADALAGARRDLQDAVARFKRAGQLALRYEGGIPGTSGGADVRLTYGDGAIRLADERTKRLVATFDPAAILAAIPSAKRSPVDNGWRGMLGAGTAGNLVWGGHFTIAAMSDYGVVQVGLANPPGFFATHARNDYFVGLAAEFADLCSAAARVRELDGGPIRYARAIGLARSPAVEPAAWEAAAPTAPSVARFTSPSDSPGGAAAGKPTSAGRPPEGAAAGQTLSDRLAQLDEAFRSGLISAAERDAKREEILRRF